MKRPLLLPFSLLYSAVHACFLFQMLSLWVASLAPAQPSSWTTAGYFILSLWELLTVCISAGNLHGILTQRFTDAQLTDRFLLTIAIIIPAFQVLVTLFHPPFLAVERNWAAGSAFMLSLGVSVFSFPPAHALVHWTVSTGVSVSLECYGRVHRQQQCRTGALDVPGCLLTQGLFIGVTGLACCATAYVLVNKGSTQLRSQADNMTKHSLASEAGDASGSRSTAANQQQQQEPAPPARTPLPFESWGLQMPPAAAAACHRLEQLMAQLAELVNEDLLVRLVCLPVVLYSLVFCILARVQFQGLSFASMSSEAFLMYMMAWFMAGRNASNFDFSPLVLRIQSSVSASLARVSRQPSLTELVDRLRQHVAGGGAKAEATPGTGHQITVTELLGEGAFGKVYKGVWRGTSVAVKRMVLPGSLNKSERRERMAIMEAAISGALVHPNIVQTYTYTVQSVQGGSTGGSEVHVGDTLEHVSTVHWDGSVPGSAAPASSAAADGLEVQLVLEYMDCGTLRDVLDDGCFEAAPPPDVRGPPVNYYAVLETAADVAKGMMHLHSLNVVHCDLKARNVLLRSCASDPRSFTAKVGDFGLSLKLDGSQAAVDNAFHGTPTHMAPEVHTHGRQSKAADVFSFGVTMWELYTGGRAFQNINRALLGYHIAELGGRPHFPPNTPRPFAALAARCWDQDPSLRPRFEEVVDRLLALIPAEVGDVVPVPVTVLGAQVTVFRPMLDAPLYQLLHMPAAAADGLAPAAAVGCAVRKLGLGSSPCSPADVTPACNRTPDQQAQSRMQRIDGSSLTTSILYGSRGQRQGS